MLWPLDVNSQLTGKDLHAYKAWKNWAIEDEMVTKHHWLNGYESEQTLGDSEGQECLACCICGATKSQTWFSDWITAITKIWDKKFYQKFCDR